MPLLSHISSLLLQTLPQIDADRAAGIIGHTRLPATTLRVSPDEDADSDEDPDLDSDSVSGTDAEAQTETEMEAHPDPDKMPS